MHGTEPERPEIEERWTEAQAEIERLQAAAADSEARALHFQEITEKMRRELAGAQEELASCRQQISGLDEELSAARNENGELHARLQAAASKYRQVLLAAAPELPEEMVQGKSIEEIEASLEKARQTVLHIRERLESHAQAGRVPAGSPARTAPDFSALSAIEKIRLGLSRK